MVAARPLPPEGSAADPAPAEPERGGTSDKPALAAFLLRSFIDLEPCLEGPLYARSLEHYWNAFADTRRPRFALQRALPRRFRVLFLAEVHLPQYHVEDPRDLSPSLSSARWRAMCDALDRWCDLATGDQCRLVLLLHALCFYSVILACVPDTARSGAISSSDDAELAHWRASARYVLGRPDRIRDYRHADVAEFAAIAQRAPPESVGAFNAALKVLVHKAKIGDPAGELVVARTEAEEILEAVIATADDFDRELLLSRFYRAAAFVPQRSDERAEVVRLMDLAERHSVAMAPRGDEQRLIYLENLHALYESRTKEAMWLGDLDLALVRALRLVEVDPRDPKIWLELGQVRRRRGEPALAAQAYLIAATLGSPATAIGRHMAGVSLRESGQPILAAYLFKAALEADPSGISPHDEIQALPDLPAFAALKQWSLSCVTL